MAKAPHPKMREVLKAASTGKLEVRKVASAVRGVHVLPRGTSQWEVKRMGPEQTTRVFGQKTKAVEWATQLAQSKRTSVFVHRRNSQGKTSISRKRA
jgi:hypothetical protein